MASEKVTKLIEEVKELTVLELSDLVSALEEEFGVSAQAPVAAVAAAPAAAGAAPAAEENLNLTQFLKKLELKKIQVVKEVKTITGLGLKDAKALVDGAPKTIKEGVAKKEAEEIKQKLEAVGATVELA